MKVLKFIVLLICINSLVFSQWDKYPAFEEYINTMNKFGTDYPQLCKVVEFGKSVKDRQLLAVKISDNVNEEEKEPSFLYHSAMHGDETLGFILMQRLADYLLSNYGSDDFVKRLIDNVEIWLCPLFNPDGTYQNDNSTVERARRYNANNRDINRNFPDYVAGDHPDNADWQKETIAMMELAKEQHFVMSANIHGGTLAVQLPADSFPTGLGDEKWWYFVAGMYADTANNISSNYQLEIQPPSPWPWYVIHGTWTRYALYFQQCRDITLELSTQKLLAASQLSEHWEYNYRSLLNYIGQVLYGVHGTVTDSLTGKPLHAKIFVENHDKDSSWVFSHLPHGDYYRPIFEGTYDITFSAVNYVSKTIKDVVVKSGEAAVLDVTLTDHVPVINASESSLIKNISINNASGIVKISYQTGQNAGLHFSIFDLNGRLIKTLVRRDNGIITWDGVDNNNIAVSSGCYIVQVKAEGSNYSKNFVFSR